MIIKKYERQAKKINSWGKNVYVKIPLLIQKVNLLAKLLMS